MSNWYPYHFGHTAWAKRIHARVEKMRRTVRDDDQRIADVVAKRERRMRRNRLGFGVGYAE